MTEIFQDINNEVKETAEALWNMALKLNDSLIAAKFLNNATNYYSNIYTEKEIEFLRFYFNMQLEMMKE